MLWGRAVPVWAEEFGRSSLAIAVPQRAIAHGVAKLASPSVRSLPADLANYAEANRQFRLLVGTAGVILDPATEEPREAVWRERQANQGVPSVSLPLPAKCALHSPERELLYRAHAALLKLLPNHQAELDHRLQVAVRQFAPHHDAGLLLVED
jgi:hypothetical protein